MYQSHFIFESFGEFKGVTLLSKSGLGNRKEKSNGLIENLKEELQSTPAFTRALAVRYFTSIDGIPNDSSRKTIFSHGDRQYSVGYQYQYHAPAGRRETLEASKKRPNSKEVLRLEAHKYLRGPNDFYFTHEGAISLRRTDADGLTTTTIGTFQAAHTLIRRLITSTAEVGFRFFE